MMDRSGFPPRSWRSFATALAGIAVLAASVVAMGLGTGPLLTGEAAHRTPAVGAPATTSHLGSLEATSAETDALAAFGEAGAVRLLSDLGILALQGGPARDVQVGGTQRGIVVRAMPSAAAPDVTEPTDGIFVARPDEMRGAGYTVAAGEEYLVPGQRDGAPGPTAGQHEDDTPTWLADLIAWLLGWLERLQGG